MPQPTFNPLTWLQGQNNMGGYQNWVGIIPLDFISSMPELPSSQTSDGDFVTASGAFVFKEESQGVPYKPIFIYNTEETVKYSSESAGERDGKSFNNKMKFFHPGNKTDAHAFATRIKNRPCIIVFADSDGNQQIMGSKFLPAYISPSFDGGEKRADQRGFTFEAAAASNQSAVFLETPFVVDPLAGTIAYAQAGE